MELIDIVNKLVGNIEPIADASVDEERFENLKTYCSLINDMLIKVDNIACDSEGSKLYSLKRVNDYLTNFFNNSLKIPE